MYVVERDCCCAALLRYEDQLHSSQRAARSLRIEQLSCPLSQHFAEGEYPLGAQAKT